MGSGKCGYKRARWDGIGRTRDDAAGEAFDKAARLLNLGFPGGPEVDKYSSFSDEHFDFPRALLRGSHDFSFSGMKTAFLNLSEKNKPFDEDKISKLCNTFQEAIVDVITEKTIKILGITKAKPQREIIIFTIIKSLRRFKDSAKGIANRQLINADKKAW